MLQSQTLPECELRCLLMPLFFNSFSNILLHRALKDAVLPLLWPIKSADGGSEIKEIFVPKGTDVVIAIMGANKSKIIWGEDAEEWKPSRWLSPLPESIQKAHLPGVYSQM